MQMEIPFWGVGCAVKINLNLVLGLPSAISHLEKIPPQQGTKAPAKQQQDIYSYGIG